MRKGVWMRIDSLRLRGFRNYGDEYSVFSPKINVITGANAQGKTNLLEAVFLITGAKSFRTRYDRELINHREEGRETAEIEAVIFSHERSHKVNITIYNNRRRKIGVNGVKKSPAELGGTFTAVLFCPDDLNIIKEGAADRRRLLDVAIGQLRTGYAKAISEYTRLYGHKMGALRSWREKPSLLNSLDEFSEALCRAGATIIRHRAAFVKRLDETSKSIHSQFSGGQEELSLLYRTDRTVSNPLAQEKDIFSDLMERQKALRQAEIDSGMCLFGAHKDDVDIFINGRSARSFASQGQARTAAVSIKLAERELFLEETGEYPILLLDDVLSELDRERQEFVLNKIVSGQTLITCCDDDRILERTAGRVIFVSNGKIIAADAGEIPVV